jgi:hypothetical protein
MPRVPNFYRPRNSFNFAAIRLYDFGNRPALGRPFGQFCHQPDTPLVSLSSRCRFPRPTPERREHHSRSPYAFPWRVRIWLQSGRFGQCRLTAARGQQQTHAASRERPGSGTLRCRWWEPSIPSDHSAWSVGGPLWGGTGGPFCLTSEPVFGADVALVS